MKALVGFAVIATAFVLSPDPAAAHHRITHAAVGGFAGAVIFGPVGLLGGGIIGYTAGPRISCGLGVRRCYRHHHHRHYSHHR